MDVNSLAHTKWNCKYHVVFAPKYRRKIIYNQLRQDIETMHSINISNEEIIKLIKGDKKWI